MTDDDEPTLNRSLGMLRYGVQFPCRDRIEYLFSLLSLTSVRYEMKVSVR